MAHLIPVVCRLVGRRRGPARLQAHPHTALLRAIDRRVINPSPKGCVQTQRTSNAQTKVSCVRVHKTRRFSAVPPMTVNEADSSLTLLPCLADVARQFARFAVRAAKIGRTHPMQIDFDDLHSLPGLDHPRGLGQSTRQRHFRAYMVRLNRNLYSR